MTFRDRIIFTIIAGLFLSLAVAVALTIHCVLQERAIVAGIEAK